MNTDLSEWKLTCEARGTIPLPRDLAFGDVLSRLSSRTNSFYILEHTSGKYIQCGGSKSACTVELRHYDQHGKYIHIVIGHANGSKADASVMMSSGGLSVQAGEVLTAIEAAELFALFIAGEKFPKKYALREKDI